MKVGRHSRQSSADHALVVVAWNLRESLETEARLLEFMDIVRTRKWRMCAVVGSWKWRPTGQYSHDEYTLLWSRAVNNAGSNTGVGCFVHASVMPALVDWRAVSGRILQVRFQAAAGQFVTFLFVYAPVWGSDQRQQSMRKLFFESLTRAVRNVHHGDMLVVKGDFNSRVGMADGGASSQVLGNFGERLRARPKSGKELISFCEQNGMVVANTYFRHRPSHRYTWRMIDRSEYLVNDYTLVRREQLCSVVDVRAMPGGTDLNSAFCTSDHHPLVTTLRLKVAFSQVTQKVPALERTHLQFEDTATAMADAADSRVQELQINTDTDYVQFAKAVMEAAHSTLPERIDRQDIHAMSDRAGELSQQRKSLYVQATRNGTMMTNEVRLELAVLKRQQRNRVTRDRQQAFRSVAEQLSKSGRYDSSRVFYSALKRAGQSSASVSMDVVDDEGKLAKLPKQQAAAFAQHFERVLNCDSMPAADVMMEMSTRAQFVVPAPDHPSPSEEQVIEAVRAQKLGKASDEYGMCADYMRAVCREGSPCSTAMTNIVTDVWKNRRLSPSLCRSLMVAIYKNNNKTREQRGNYRGVTLVTFIWRVCMYLVLHDWAIPVIDGALDESQAGSRPGRGCPDHMFTLRVLQEAAAARRLPLMAAFIDLAKAFDSIHRKLLFLMMRSYGMPILLVEIFEALYNSTSCAVRVASAISAAFATMGGVQQGCLSGSWCFNLYIHCCLEPIMEELTSLGVEIVYSLRDGRQMAATRVGGADTASKRIGVLMVVDDTTLIATSMDGLQKGLELIHQQFLRFGLQVNVEKTEALHYAGVDSLSCEVCQQSGGSRKQTIMCDVCDRGFHLHCLSPPLLAVPDGTWRCVPCGGDDISVATCAQESVLKPVIQMGEQRVKWVTIKKYLGGIQSDDCSLDEEVSARIQAARAAATKHMRPLLGQGNNSQHMCGCIAMCFTALIASVLLYGGESWALSSEQLQRLEVFQRTCLRKALPRRRMTHWISNARLLALFKLPSVATMVARKQLRWIGHLARMDDQRLPAIMTSASLAQVAQGVGIQGRGKPSLLGVSGPIGVYTSLISNNLDARRRREVFGGSRAPWHELAAERSQWKDFVRSVFVH